MELSQVGLVLLITVVAVAFLVLALSLTLIFKGHHIQSEIGENPHMKERGIKCAAQQMRAEERDLRAGSRKSDVLPGECEGGDCRTCTSHCSEEDR